MDISPENFKRFFYIIVDTEHQKDAHFTQSLLHAYIDSSNSITIDPNIIDNDSFPLRNNIRDPVLLENRTNC